MLIFDASIDWQHAINILAFPVTACYCSYMINVVMVLIAECFIEICLQRSQRALSKC